MSEPEKQEMTWQERLANVAQVVTVLEGIDTKGGDRDTELLNILEMVAQTVYPRRPVELRYRLSRCLD
jgi:hypothetical protein